MIKVTIVEDHAAVRAALEKMISEAEGFELVGSYSELQEAIVLIPLDDTGCCADGYQPGKWGIGN